MLRAIIASRSTYDSGRMVGYPEVTRKGAWRRSTWSPRCRLLARGEFHT